MKQVTSNENVEYLKRLAKKIKKEQKITHQKSLDIVAKNKGYNNWKHFLNFTKTNHTAPLKKDIISNDTLLKNAKIDPRRNLLVGAINYLLSNNHISLDISNINSEEENGHVLVNLFGHNTAILWSNMGFDELLISVWWKYNHKKHPQANLEGRSKESFSSREPLAKKQYYKNFVGVVTSCWLERRSGKFIQGKNQEHIAKIYTRSGELKFLKEIPQQIPIGYESYGPIFY